MAKNLNHHMYKDKATGIWYFQKKVRGQPKAYKLSLETKAVGEARKRRDEYLDQIRRNGYINQPTPHEAMPLADEVVFGEVAKQWSEIVKTRIEKTTFYNYQKVTNNRILPYFGNRPIASITSLEIEVFISKMTCGSKTKMNVLTPMRMVMKFAKKHKIIQVNPFVDVEPIKRTKGKPAVALNLDEVRRFLDALDDYWKPLFVVLFFSGLRIAEAAGLKWKRVDLAQGIIKVQRNVVFVRNEPIYKTPKTESSIRDVKVPGFVVEALREQRKRTWKGDGENFVFVNTEGRLIHRHTLNHIVIQPALEKADIDIRISVKDTRASFITNALDENERLSYIQKQVGHATTRMIVDHYYRHVPAPDDGGRLEKAWKSTSIPPVQDEADLQVVENKG
ncbi:MAG: site-specific integrase [Pseudodesulfovibrio sp.]|nr:site-specific integrase [Pseudodesulfovibrio sp.]